MLILYLDLGFAGSFAVYFLLQSLEWNQSLSQDIHSELFMVKGASNWAICILIELNNLPNLIKLIYSWNL